MLFPPGRLNRRQLLAAAAGLGLAASVGPLTGCSRNVSISADPAELVLWYWNRSISPKLLARAAEQIPDTAKRLRADVIGGTFDTKLRTSLAGKAYIPDITAVNSNCALYFTNEDQFVDLNTLGAEEFKTNFFDWKWQLGTTPTGRFCFWPMDTGPTGLYYRSDLFEAAGLPTEPDEVGAAVRTWDQLIELGAKLRADSGVALIANATMIFNQYLNASTERYFDSGDRPLYARSDSAVRQAWDTAVAAIEAKITGNLQIATDQNSGWVSARWPVTSRRSGGPRSWPTPPRTPRGSGGWPTSPASPATAAAPSWPCRPPARTPKPPSPSSAG